MSGSGFGYSSLNGVACEAGVAVAGGYWSAIREDDLGQVAVAVDVGGYASQLASVRRAPTEDGRSWEQVAELGETDLYGSASATPPWGWPVGRGGVALRSDDGGVSWVDISTGLDLFLGGVGWLPGARWW